MNVEKISPKLKAFSLIEISIVILVIAILIAGTIILPEVLNRAKRILKFL